MDPGHRERSFDECDVGVLQHHAHDGRLPAEVALARLAAIGARVLHDRAGGELLEIGQQLIDRTIPAHDLAQERAELLRIHRGELRHRVDHGESQALLLDREIHVEHADGRLLILDREILPPVPVDDVTGALVDDDVVDHPNALQPVLHDELLRGGVQAPIQRIVFQLARIDIRAAEDARLPTRSECEPLAGVLLRGAHSSCC